MKIKCNYIYYHEAGLIVFIIIFIVYMNPDNTLVEFTGRSSKR